MKKNPQTKARQKRVLALVKTKFPRRRKGWGLIVLPFYAVYPYCRTQITQGITRK